MEVEKLVRVRAGRLAISYWMALFAALSGCAGYRWGTQAIYRPDIRTVHVPIFSSETLRRNLGEWLTEAVVKEIEKTTPYKVVSTASADSILRGSIVSAHKRVLSENPFDEPSEVEFGLLVSIHWVDCRGMTLIERSFGIPDLLVNISETADLVPDAGQSIVSAQQEAMLNLAAEIVGQMEMPW